VSIWIIEPHDPLIFRDGRPFGPTPGARAFSLPFPFPSTLAGVVRHQVGLDEQGRFRYTKPPQETAEEKKHRQAILDELKQLHVRGPFLIELNEGYKKEQNKGKEEGENDKPYTWLLPAPHDALLFDAEDDNNTADKKKRYDIHQIVPLTLPQGAMTDFGELPSSLTLAGLPTNLEGKATDGPTYWKWETFKRWLTDPSLLTKEAQEESEIGHNGPERELRVHIMMQPERGAAKDEALFDTSGMEFTRREKDLDKCSKLALAVVVDEEDTQWKLRAGPGSFGSERRLVMWRQDEDIASLFLKEMQETHDEIIESIVQKSKDQKSREKAYFCRIVLLTPAYFEQGYEPNWQRLENDDVRLELRARVVKRPQVVSGWDMDEGKPKPSRRLAPAGTVYYLSLHGTEEAIRQWVRDRWFQPISDEQSEQYRNDGFGVALIGTWSGKQEEIKVK
jgi:CRISPR-associated protein Cmr3